MPTHDPTAGRPGDLDALHRRVESIPGWLTRDQAACLAEHATRISRGGVVVEIGSHEGRSTVVLGASVPAGARVLAIDPFPRDWRYGSSGTEQRLRANLHDAGLDKTVEVRVASSRSVLERWSGQVDLVYVDGKHDVRSTIHDIGWARHLRSGGHLLVHDSFSSIGVTVALLLRVLPARDLRYLSRTGSLAVLERARPSWGHRVALLRQLPWWLRNIGIKVLLRLRLRALARLAGHHDTADPY
ncbi:MAG: class I SAM-dependent methyltransferase [Marmoricola sp.]